MTRFPVSAVLALLMMLPVTAGAQSAGDSVIAVPADTLRSESEFRAASTRYAAAVRVCYEREGLKEDPSLSATVDIGMTVQPDGSVKEITIDTLFVTGVGISRVAECVAKAATSWRFTSGAYGLERTILTFKLIPPRTR